MKKYLVGASLALAIAVVAIKGYSPEKPKNHVTTAKAEATQPETKQPTTTKTLVTVTGSVPVSIGE